MRWLLTLPALLTFVISDAGAADLSPHIKAINSVGREGAGSEAAGKAVKALASAPADSIPELLAAFDGASSLAANYFRSIVETVVDRQLSAGNKLPAKQIEQVVLDRKGDPRARRLGYEILLRLDPKAEARIIPGMLLDPSPDFRRDAVQRLIAEAKSSSGKAAAVAKYREALSGATDSDQVKAVTKSLRDAGEEVDLIKHFGFLTKWKIVGPFDNKDFIGFDRTYPPETKIDLTEKLEGQLGEVTWGEISTKQEYGIIDVAKSISPYKGAVMYLTATFNSDASEDVEFRFGTPNAWKLWVNGDLKFGRDEYHRGMAIDQYRVPAKLKKGENVILVKLCQNEQEDSWAQRYQLQIRVCKSTGIAVYPVAALNAARSATVASTNGDSN